MNWFISKQVRSGSIHRNSVSPHPPCKILLQPLSGHQPGRCQDSTWHNHEACVCPLSMDQPLGSWQERIRWAGSSTGSRATCPYRGVVGRERRRDAHRGVGGHTIFKQEPQNNQWLLEWSLWIIERRPMTDEKKLADIYMICRFCRDSKIRRFTELKKVHSIHKTG